MTWRRSSNNYNVKHWHVHFLTFWQQSKPTTFTLLSKHIIIDVIVVYLVHRLYIMHTIKMLPNVKINKRQEKKQRVANKIGTWLLMEVGKERNLAICKIWTDRLVCCFYRFMWNFWAFFCLLQHVFVLLLQISLSEFVFM